MKLYSASIKALFLILVIFGYINQIYAVDSNAITTTKILWQKEVVADINLNCSPGQVAFDKTTNKLLIASISYHSSPSKDYSGDKFWLLEVDPNSGNVVKKHFLKNITEKKVTAISAPLLLSSLAVSENNDVTLVGKFDGIALSTLKLSRQGIVSEPVEFINKNNHGEESIRILNRISLPGDNVLLIGEDEDHKGLMIKVNSEGKRLWKRSYRIGQGQVDLFIDGLTVASGEEFIIIGCSTEVSGKFPATIGDDFVVWCNAQGDIIAEDVFSGNPWEQPKICQLSSGNFVVVYGKGMMSKCSDINIRAYSPDLKLLWEKPVVKSEKNKPSSFRIATTPQNGFIVAANVDFGNLRVYEYDKDGNQIASLSMDKEVWVGNIGLVCMDKKAFVVFQTRPDAGQNEGLSRIKIIALEIK